MLNSEKLSMKILVAFLESIETSKIDPFVKIVNGIIYYFQAPFYMFEWVLNTPLSFGNTWK